MNIIIRNIEKSYGKQKVLDNVCFSVKEGELIGFLGPNGAGKSTLMKIITGYLPSDSGEILIDDNKINATDIGIRKHIGYLPENNPLYSDLYITEHLRITAGFYKVPDPDKRIKEVIELTGLVDERQKKTGLLSKGYKQRVGLAQALIHDPAILILDEPTTGLDPNQLHEIRNLIKEISKEKTVILSTHIMQEVEAICDRVVIINKGKIIANATINELKTGKLNTCQTITAGFIENVEIDQLLAVEGVKNAYYDGSVWHIVSDGSCDIRQGIFHFAVKNNLTLLTLFEKQENLESIFRQITQ